ncbi:hypothetical protein [Streptomyces sp. NPDC004134]|uniref:scabin-related ADP-ribosyltransferase n=1 Tax=Streptomyces sp. NPDC004134 TaxID=3364691 RepID=UPI0036C5DFC3
MRRPPWRPDLARCTRRSPATPHGCTAGWACTPAASLTSVSQRRRLRCPMKSIAAPARVYRGDLRPPITVYASGFRPWGTSTDLRAYATADIPSAFVGTSLSARQAANFSAERRTQRKLGVWDPESWPGGQRE